MSISLNNLPFDLMIAMAVFCRVGALFMSAPALGDFSLIPRIRLVAALAVTVALLPVVTGYYPVETQLASIQSGTTAAGHLVFILGTEIILGLFLGLMARIFVSALNVAGQIIAFQIGLSLAQIFDPTQEIQGAIIGGFLAVFGTTMIFVTDLHHLLLVAVKDSYLLFTPGALLQPGDMAAGLVDSLSQAFSLGFRLAAPFILFGLVFYVTAGILNRLIPQVQVFFMLLPANLMIGLLLLMLTSGMIMSVFLGEFETYLLTMVRG